MALSVISVAFQQLEIIEEREEQKDQNLIPGFRKHLKKIRSDLVSINGKLNEEIKLQITTLEDNSSVLEKLKDVAYEINDVLDQWNSTFDKSKKEQMEGGGKSEDAPLLKKMRSFIAPMQCFSPIAGCNDIMQKIEHMNKKVADLVQDNIIQVDNSDVLRIDGLPVMEKTEPFLGALEDIVGREKDIKILMSKLLEEVEQPCAVICISGVAGVGKTNLARLILKEKKVKKHFENRLLWVPVSNPFNEVKVAKAIIKEFEGVSPDTNEIGPLLKRIRSLIKAKKFLLVLDNLTADGYNKRGQLERYLRSGVRGSRILVTTDDEVPDEIANIYTHKLEKLSEADSEMLFSTLALHSRSDGECERLQDTANELAKRCDRLPLALKMLGCLMRKKEEKEWKDVLCSDFWKLADKEIPYPRIMVLSYYQMPFVLRHCFTCCAVFPKHERIEKATLVKLWMAHGFLRKKESEMEKLDDSSFNMEKLGESYFNRLAEHSCFQDLEKDKYTGEVVSCRLHEKMHDFANALLGKEFILEEAIEENLLSRIEDEEAEAGSNRNSSGAKNEATDKNVETGGNGNLSRIKTEATEKNVRTLWIRYVSGPGNLNGYLVNKFTRLTSLRVLNLSESLITEIPKEVEELIHLRYLNLSKNKHLKALPAELCKLRNLQTLNVNWCLDLAKLPLEIGRLIKLRHFENLGTYKLKYLPKGIAKLTSIQTLLRFPISDEDEEQACNLEELNQLRNLTNKLGIIGLGNLTRETDVKNVNLQKKSLVKLELDFSSSRKKVGQIKDAKIIHAFQLHANLKHLVISGYRGASLSFKWLGSIKELRRLELIKCTKLKRLPPLGLLPHLTFLHIQGMRSVKKIDAEFLGISDDGPVDPNQECKGFPSLQYLEFWGMKQLKSWDVNLDGHAKNIKIMPKLCFLTFQSCPKLRDIPSFIQSCKSLKELTVQWCSVLEQTCKVEGANWSRIHHVEDIIVDHRYIQKDGKPSKTDS